ncbi:MAG: M1 family aminopeptidase [candidate division Zixibacteria bacterium]
MSNHRIIRITIMLTAIITLGILGNSQAGIPDIPAFEKNMKDKNEQTALTGNIESMIIKRPSAEFRLGPGRVALFNFGASRPCAMVYEGNGIFMYEPPDDIERGQLVKFTKREWLEDSFESLVIFFTAELDDFPDTSGFIREKAPGKAWKKLSSKMEDAFDHLHIHMPNKLIGDLLTEFPGFYFYADLNLSGVGHLVFKDDPMHADQYRIFKLRRIVGADDYDVLGGYSTDNGLPSQRGLQKIDITNYKIESKIEGSGKMNVKCRIEYTPLRWGCNFIEFQWYPENKKISAFDSNGDTLLVIHRKDEFGFGVVLNKPLEIGNPDYIDVIYECKSLKSVYGLIYVFGKTSWFPSNYIRDKATFELKYDIPKSYEVVSCGKRVDLNVENGRAVSRWIVDPAVEYVSFNVGVFENKEIIVEGFPPVKVFMSEQIDHKAIALYNAYFGNLSSGDMIGQVSADVTNSLAFFTSVFGPCPFDTIKATEIPFTGEGQGSPGLIHLTWSTFQSDDIQGYSESFRAHEVAHQWWGHVVDYESYRDVWITEGLATFSGLWFYELSVKDRKAVKSMLKLYREIIFEGSGSRQVGTKAGPMTIGYRLSSSKSSDYYNIVYRKGAYIFHMIRYLLHDYKTGSDDAFAAFLKDLAQSYKDKIITTPLLQELLEKHIGSDMTWFFDQWVYGTAIPEYKFSYESEKTADGKYAVVCGVKQEKVPDNFKMLVPITVIFDDDRYIHLKIWVDKPEADIELPNLPFKPKKIIFNTFDAVLCKVDYK